MQVRRKVRLVYHEPGVLTVDSDLIVIAQKNSVHMLPALPSQLDCLDLPEQWDMETKSFLHFSTFYRLRSETKFEDQIDHFQFLASAALLWTVTPLTLRKRYHVRFLHCKQCSILRHVTMRVSRYY